MLQVYYDVNCADEFDELFGDLDVGKNPTEEHNKYLILKFNFSAVNPVKEKVIESFNKEALDQLEKYSTAKQLQQKAEGNAGMMFQGEQLHWNHLAAFACLIMAVYFVFLK